MSPDVRELLRRDVAASEYEQIRELWKRHSIAEDERDLPGLISTLTEDCVYELVQTGHRWEGHEGAARFYGELLAAFPDIHFDLTDIVIGPQGVCEEADVIGTHQAAWLGFPPSGKRLAWKVVIFFPWDPAQRLFRGEKVYMAGLPLAGQALVSVQTTTSKDPDETVAAAVSPNRPYQTAPTKETAPR